MVELGLLLPTNFCRSMKHIIRIARRQNTELASSGFCLSFGEQVCARDLSLPEILRDENKADCFADRQWLGKAQIKLSPNSGIRAKWFDLLKTQQVIRQILKPIFVVGLHRLELRCCNVDTV